MENVSIGKCRKMMAVKAQRVKKQGEKKMELGGKEDWGGEEKMMGLGEKRMMRWGEEEDGVGKNRKHWDLQKTGRFYSRGLRFTQK